MPNPLGILWSLLGAPSSFGFLLLAACAAEGPCHSSGDCAKGLYCVGPNDWPGCGMGPRRACDSDRNCGPGLVCHAIGDACSSTGVGSECRETCSTGTCDTGLRCNAAGACEPVPCNEGFRCSSIQRCDAAAAHATGPVWNRSTGCVSIPCTADGDCPAGKACVNAYCQDGPGFCKEEILVP